MCAILTRYTAPISEGEVCAWALVLSAHTQTCSALIASEPVLQPAHALVDTDMLLCASCAQRLSPELVASEFRVLRCFRCDSPRLEDMGLLSASAAAPSLSEPVRLHWLRLLMDTAVAAQVTVALLALATVASEAYIGVECAAHVSNARPRARVCAAGGVDHANDGRVRGPQSAARG